MRRTHYDRSSTEPRPYDDAIPHLCLSTDGPSSKCRKRRPRALRPVRAQAGGGTRRRTAPSSAVRRSVPVRTFADWHDPPPGFVEADLVAHSGPSASGSFVQMLVLTDIATGWTECGPLLVREQGLLSSHSRGAPGWMKRLLWCGRQGDWFCLGVSEPVTEFDRRPFEHPLLSPGTVAGQLRSASVLEHVR